MQKLLSRGGAAVAAVMCLTAAGCTTSGAAPSPQHLSNWTAYGDAGYTVDNAVQRNGHSTLRSDLKDTAGAAGASTVVTLNQTVAAPIVVAGWSKAQAVGGTADGEYSLYVDIIYTDGTPLWGQIVPFDSGTHDWQQRRLTIATPKPVKSLNVYALFRHHTGTVWFDDFEARELSTSSQFDGQEITPPSVTSSSAGGWYVRDLSAGSDAVVPIAQSAAVKLSVGQGGDVVRARLSNATNAVHCVTLYYVERYAPKSAVWWDDIRTKRAVDAGAEYGNLTAVSVGASGLMSVYPYGCVAGSTSARVLGVPAGLGPRITRIGYNGRLHLYYVAYDIALTPRGDGHSHDHADVGVVRYNVDPHWGFRAATAGYYSRFPAAFERRAKADGIWMPFTDPSTISDVADFHIAYHEGDNSVAGDRGKGILSFRYIEPMTFWMNMDAKQARTYDNAVSLLKSHADDGSDSRETRAAKAVLASGSMDAGGHYNVTFQNTPWSNGAMWLINPNPSIEHRADDWTGARINSLALPAAGKANEPDGVYLDSLESWSDSLDYGDRSLAASTAPLTFTPTNLRPVVPTWFSVYEDTQKLSQDLHARKKLLMANSTPIKYPVLGGLLDVMGIETNWFPDGKWIPDSDATFNLRRTVSYHKPYLLLQNTNFNLMTKEYSEKYFRRCAFYGVFPSFFSADAATNPYWQNTDLYNRDRPLFKLYMPIISGLSKAGWEPVTYASTADPKVWVERYGKKYVTVLNSADAPSTTRLSVDLGKIGVDIRGRKIVSVADAVTGAMVATAPSRPVISVPVEVAGGETRVLSINLN